ncbi:MAG: DUF5666 domain-containing protein [Acidimicrobiales bacterium]|jgi:hypothetical protein
MTQELTDNANDEGFDILFGNESEEWPERAASKGYRASWFVTVLSALLLLVAGLWLGAYLQRGQPSSSSSSLSGLFAAGAGARGGTTGFSALAKAAANETSGTVTDIVGHTLYVTNSSGSLIAVKVSSSTTIDRNASTALAGLKPGDTVTVQGKKVKGGSVDATSISDTAKGVTSTGFGGGAFP